LQQYDQFGQLSFLLFGKQEDSIEENEDSSIFQEYLADGSQILSSSIFRSSIGPGSGLWKQVMEEFTTRGVSELRE